MYYHEAHNRTMYYNGNMNAIIKTAISYLNNNDRLIYSYRGNTFIQDGELHDTEHDGRGRIDCSTLVHLAQLGIEYDDSPYASGDISRFFDTVCPWYDIARLAISSGKATIGDVFAHNSARENDIRRAYGLAKYCRESGLELKSFSERRPGDLVFFEAPLSVYEEYRKYGAYMAISHVGIVAEDIDLMINATGRSRQDYNAQHDPVRLMPISEKGKPVITARLVNQKQED